MAREYHHPIVINNSCVDLTEVHKKLDRILRRIDVLTKEIIIMAQDLTELESAVTENTDLDGSIIQLLNGLAAQIESMKADPAKIAALAAQLRGKSAELAAAIQANTPPPVPVE